MAKPRGLFDWFSKPEGREPPPHVEPAEPGHRAPRHTGEIELAQVTREQPQVELDQRLLDEGEIAKGGMSSVRKVLNRNLLRREAMKVLTPSASDIEREVNRFFEEAQITGQLDHPNIPPVHELGTDGSGAHYFTMKLVRGKTLEQVVNEPDFNPADDQKLFEVLQVLLKVCDAVAFAHSRGVIHCDLKPSNVMVGTFGQVYVMDWGIARLKTGGRVRAPEEVVATDFSADRDADHGKVMGTLSYMSPEQALGLTDHIDQKSDVFTLGGILYRILTARPPNVGQTPQATWELAKKCDIRPPQQLVDDLAGMTGGTGRQLPWRLCKIAQKALSRERAGRQASVLEFKAEVEDFLRGAGRYPVETHGPNTVVIREGEAGNSAYVIAKGTARAWRSENGVEKTLRTMGPGDVFGEMALLTDRPRTANVSSTSELTIVRVTREGLERELGQTFWVGHILKALAQRFREADERLQKRGAEIGVDARIREEALRFITFRGNAMDEDHRLLKWSVLEAHLVSRFEKPANEWQGVLKGMEGLVIDLSRDEVVLTRSDKPLSPFSAAPRFDVLEFEGGEDGDDGATMVMSTIP